MVSKIVTLRLEGSAEKITENGELGDYSYLSDDQLLEMIDSMSREELGERGNYASKKGMMRHYGFLHKAWIQKFDYYLGEDIGHKPSEEELMRNPEFNMMCQRFRVFYGMKHGDKVEWLDGSDE